MGPAGQLFATAHRIAPDISERLMAVQVRRHHLTHRSAAITDGNLAAPMEGTTTSEGRWPAERGSKGGPIGRGRAVVDALRRIVRSV